MLKTFFRVALFGFALSLAGCTCANSPELCQSNSECAANESCLAIQKCAVSCKADADCGAGKKCSAAGGCVAQSGCGADGDCTTGQICNGAETCVRKCQATAECASSNVCLANGACAAACTAASDCGAGQKCSASGGCIATGGCGTQADCNAGQTCNAIGNCVDGPSAGDDAGSNCGGELFASTKVDSNMFIAFDKSGSMKDPINGVSKWNIATGAINKVVQQHQSQIRFGLMLFPVSEQNECQPAPVSVPIADMQASAVASELSMNSPGGKTPIGAVLVAAGQVSELADTSRANYVMLVTDGTETCGGDGERAARNNLQDKGIKTFVVGFGGAVDRGNLTDIAVAGGTPRPGRTKYYQADNEAALETAFQQIAQGALGCEYKLAKVPPDPTKIFVYVNGVLQNNDPSHANGWDYSAATTRVTFYGALCKLVATDATAKVNVVYGCPNDDIVEGGGFGDGGAGLPNGSACRTNVDCSVGPCVDGICGLPVGQPCTGNAQCASQVCINGVCDPGIN